MDEMGCLDSSTVLLSKRYSLQQSITVIAIRDLFTNCLQTPQNVAHIQKCTMYLNVLLLIIYHLVVDHYVVCASTPLKLTIDCSEERDYVLKNPKHYSQSEETGYVDVNSFCGFIHKAIPQGIRDGKFVSIGSEGDQTGYSDTIVPRVLAPPKGFPDVTIPGIGLPKFKSPKFNIPKLKLPKLQGVGVFNKTPRTSTPTAYSSIFKNVNGESSVERLEKFKNGVQKLLHIIKVLGQVDRYLSERTRILVDKLSKTLAE